MDLQRVGKFLSNYWALLSAVALFLYTIGSLRAEFVSMQGNLDEINAANPKVLIERLNALDNKIDKLSDTENTLNQSVQAFTKETSRDIGYLEGRIDAKETK